MKLQVSILLVALNLTSCKTTTGGSATKADGSGGGDRVDIDFGNVLADTTTKPIGININYIVDNDANRPNGRPLADALKEMGVKYLRYPGGEKSDYQFWSKSPWDYANPQVFGYYRDYIRNVLNFDQFMDIVQKTNTEPYIVVGYDNYKNTGKTKQEYLTAAVEWVRYANIKKKYNIKYWEVGNENWHNGTGSGQDMAPIVTEFANAMKAVDPTIKVGASGDTKASADGSPFWQPFLQNGGSKSLDFLVQTNYPCQSDGCKPYRTNQQRNLSWIGNTDSAINNFGSDDDKRRLSIVIAEFNSIVWSKEWSNENDLIHALTSFDMLGQLMRTSKLNMAMMWTTRWLPGKNGIDVMYALDDKNNLTAQGQVLKLWGTYLLDKYVRVDTQGLVSAFASYSSDKKRAVVFLLNKEGSSRSVDVNLRNLDGGLTQADLTLFGGDNFTTWSPSMQKKDSLTVSGGDFTIQLPQYSISILDFHG